MHVHETHHCSELETTTMIGPMEILGIIGILLVPALIIIAIVVGGKILLDIRKELTNISEELKNNDFRH